MIFFLTRFPWKNESISDYEQDTGSGLFEVTCPLFTLLRRANFYVAEIRE